MNTDIFWQRIQEFRDLFEGGVNIENLRARLERFSQSLDEIVDIWRALIVFTGLAVVLMTMLMTAILRYHFRLFESERVVGRLV